MTENLGRIPVRRRSGLEPFTDEERKLGFDLHGFWQWSASDLVSNTTRGVLAEYLVAMALEIDVSGIRDGWAAYDLRTESGVKVEVKSATHLQSWHQDKESIVSFRTPKTRAWNPDTGQLDAEPKRHADVYVFARLAHDEKSTLNPLHVDQWKSNARGSLCWSRRVQRLVEGSARRVCRSGSESGNAGVELTVERAGWGSTMRSAVPGTAEETPHPVRLGAHSRVR